MIHARAPFAAERTPLARHLTCLGTGSYSFAEGVEVNAATQTAHLGRVIADQGFPRLAAETLLRACAYAEKSDDRFATFHVTLWLARLARQHGDPEAQAIAAMLEASLAAGQRHAGYAISPDEPRPPTDPALALPIAEAVARAAALPELMPEQVSPTPGARFTGLRLE